MSAVREGKLPDYMIRKATAGVAGFSDAENISAYCAACAQLILHAAEDAALPIHRAMNLLYEQGRKPYGITVTALLPQKISERAIKCLMRSIAAAAGAHSARIMDYNLSVSGEAENIWLSVSAYGEEAAERELRKESPKKNAFEGEKAEGGILSSETEQEPAGIRYLVQTRFAGMAGSLLLSRDLRDELRTRYTDEFLDGCRIFAENLSIRDDVRIAGELSAEYVSEAYEGGIFGALWELGEACGSGMEIWLPEILLRQETIEICEHFDISPYQLFSGGCALIVTTRPQELKAALEAGQIPASIIGKLTDGNDRIVCNQGEIRYLEPVRLDEYRKVTASKNSAAGREAGMLL